MKNYREQNACVNCKYVSVTVDLLHGPLFQCTYGSPKELPYDTIDTAKL